MATRLKWVYLAMACVWVALAVPGLLLWRDAVWFVVAMSLYANIASSIAAYQGARSEEGDADASDIARLEAKIDALSVPAVGPASSPR